MIGRYMSYLAKRWYLPVVVVLLITFFMSYELRGINFDFTPESFLPESGTVTANERMNDLFHTDYNVHYLLFSENNAEDDVLTPDSLRLGFIISKELENLDGVNEVRSIPSFYDNILKLTGTNGILSSEDGDIEDITLAYRKILSEKNSSSFVTDHLGIENGTASSLVSDSRLAADIFLSGDFINRGKATSMIALVVLEAGLSEGERKETVSDIESLCNSILNDPESYYPENVKGTGVPFEIEHAGVDISLMQTDEEVSVGIYLLSVFAILFIGTVLFFSFRRLSRVILPLLTLALALVWTFGMGLLLGLENTPLDLAIVPLVIGLGVDFSIHLLKRYDEELKSTENNLVEAQKYAFLKSANLVSKPLFIAAFTTVVAFLANIFSKVDPVFNFGILCSIGICFSLLLTLFVLFPVVGALDAYMIKRKGFVNTGSLYRGSKTPFFVGRNMKRISLYVTKYPVLVLIVVILLTTLGLISGINIDKEFSVDDFVSDSLPARVTEKKIREEFPASSSSRISYYYEGVGTPGPDLIRDIAKKMLYIEEAPHVVRGNGWPRNASLFNLFYHALRQNSTLAERYNFSSETFLPIDNCTGEDISGLIGYLEANHTIYSVLEGNDFSSELDALLYRDTEANTYATMLTIYVNARTWKSSWALVEQLTRGLEISSELDAEVTLTGWTVMVVETVDTMESSQIFGTLLAIVFAIVILLLLYRSFRYSLIGIFPVLISATWILGFMNLLSIPLNVLTITVTSLSIGIGVDYSVHIIERFREEKLNYEPERAMKRTLKHTGTSIFISAFTTVSGFFLLLAAPLSMTRVFGLITGLAVFFAFILSCVLGPVILLKSIRKNN
ncbi:MAG: MMPL family transporter [Candidatus Thermoplasmatota archaeon]|nr:MMPL family transporter [Candidatus Thermoplasmatota archaeon]